MTRGHDLPFEVLNDGDALAPSVPPAGGAVRFARGCSPC